MTTKETDLLEDVKLRETLMARVEVLDKVKNLVLLPNTELMTTKLVAKYYEVGEEAIKSIYNRSRGEVENNGAKTLRGDDLRELKSKLQDGALLGRANAVTVFSKRAVLNIGMMLRDSVIAREVRTQLLNGFEKLSPEQKVESLEEEDSLLMKILKAKNRDEQMIAISDLNIYHNEHKEKLESVIKENQPKVDTFNKFMDGTNLKSMNDVAKTLNTGRNKLFKFLKEQKVLMSNNLPYQTFMDRGYFQTKTYPVRNGDYSFNNTQTFVTPKGFTYIDKLMDKKGFERNK